MNAYQGELTYLNIQRPQTTPNHHTDAKRTTTAHILQVALSVDVKKNPTEWLTDGRTRVWDLLTYTCIDFMKRFHERLFHRKSFPVIFP